MTLRNLIPKPCKPFLRCHIGSFVHHYGFHPYHFHPSHSIEEQTLSFTYAGRRFTVKADRRTPLYDTIYEVLDYDAYQLSKIAWEPSREHFIVDIGANVGVSALVLSQLPAASVTCYEPLPDNCTFLQGNLELNQVANVRVVQAAVAGINGSLEFEVGGTSEEGHIVRDSLTTARRITVSALTIGQVVGECRGKEIDLIKMDCEGCEYAIVEQITPELAGRIRNITMEVHDLDRVHNLRRVSAHLASLGYQVTSKPNHCEYFALHTLLARRAL